VANSLVAKDMDIPVGLLPYGTSNDFADSLGLSTDPNKLMGFLDTNNIGPVDLGRIGENCFVNIFCAGTITKTSHSVDRAFKDHLGMLAYYLHSVGNLPKIASFKLTLKGDVQETFNCLLFLALNSTGGGGFKNLAPKANLNNGTLDIIAIRECSLPEMAGVFLGVLRGEHHNNPSVLYTKASYLEVHGAEDVETDMDGERGPALSVKIEVLPGRLRLVGAKQ
jgi:YegS/Rv2252/BmrU family lipid kinase